MKQVVIPSVLQAPKYLADMLPEHVKVEIDLSANENLLGPSEYALTAYHEAAKEIWRYPDGGCALLKQAIARRYALKAERIVCGAGSDELISLLTKSFVGPGDEVLFPEYSFIMYQINAIRVGAKIIKAPTFNFKVQVDEILARITERTKIIFIANPNNPTGTYIPGDELKKLVENVPSHIVLVIDSAYAEYLDERDYESGQTWVEQYANVVMLRTFSKIHGLAGLRLGWSYAQEELTDILERSRGPYNVSIPAQMAGIAAIEDERHVAMSRQHNQDWLPQVTNSFIGQGFDVIPSVCNFILVDFKEESRAQNAYQYFLENGVLTRPLKGYNLPRHLRITIGRASDNQRLLALCQALSKV